MSVDTVYVRAIKINASVGMDPWERRAKQMLEVDVDVDVDTTQLLATGSLEYGVDYSKVIATVKRVVLEGHIELVEVLADRVARTLLDETLACGVRVEVRKYGVSAGDADHVGVVVRRDRRSGYRDNG